MKTYMLIINLFIFILIILMLLFPIKIRFVRDKDITISILILGFIRIRVNVNKIMKNSNKVKNIKSYMNKIKCYYPLIKNISSMSVINKVTIVFRLNSIYLSFIAWNIVYTFRNIFLYNFLSVNNEFYDVLYKDDYDNMFCFEFCFKIRVIDVIIAYIISVKEIYENKRKGSVNNVRTSNK